MSTAKKLVTGSFVRVLEFSANAIVALLLMPFIIHSLGDRMYGLWIFVGSFIGYYGLMDFGLNSAVQRYISRATAIADNEEINRILNTALAIFTLIGLAALVLSFIMAYIMPYLIANIVEIKTFRIVILILGFNFAIGLPLRVFTGTLSAHIRYDVNTSIELVKLAIRTILILVLLKGENGIIALALITAAMDIGGYVSKYIAVKIMYKDVIVSKRFIDIARAKQLFSYSSITFVSQIADQLRLNVDNLVIALIIGLDMVTPYSIGARLNRYFIDFMSASTGMLMPVFSRYEAEKRNDMIVEKYLFMIKICGYLSFLIGGILIVFGKAFIERWVGKEYSVSYTILVVLVVPMVLALMQGPSIQLLYGISKHKFIAVSNVIEGIMNLVLSLILAKYYGIIGVAMGTAIPMAIMKLCVQPVYTCRAIGLDIKKYYVKTILPIVLRSVAVFTALWLLSHGFVTSNYLIIGLLVAVTITIFITIIFITGFDENEHEYFKKAVKNVIV